jgi:hypothetical protein
VIDIYESPATGAARLDPAELGILVPVVYASLFRAPVRSEDLRSRVTGVQVTEDEVRRTLGNPRLREFLVEEDGLVWLRSPHRQDLRANFARREASTRDLLRHHEKVLAFMRGLRSVRLAALSGGCAHGVADDGDIDVFAITERDAVWRTLMVSTLVAKARGWRRVLCLNYLVDPTAQALPWRDFYGAFEVISLKPFKGEAAFAEFLAANPWIDSLFPNFLSARLSRQNSANPTPAASPGGRLLENMSRMILRPYLRYRLPEGSGVELSEHSVRLHANDHRPGLRGRFRDALLNIGVEAPSWI